MTKTCVWRLAGPNEPKCDKPVVGVVESSSGIGYVPSCKHHLNVARTIGYERTGSVIEFPKLSATQVDQLRQMSTAKDGASSVPSGYSSAGRDASRWWRTMEILERAKLVTRKRGGWFVITPVGRAVVEVRA